MGSRVLAEARALRAAFPDANAMGELPVSAVDVEAPSDFQAALGYLRDEMLVVRTGEAADLTVLDDEIANVERLLRQV